MAKYTEKDIENAIRSGVSNHQAAKQYGIPRSTLIERLRGRNSRTIANSDQQKLSNTLKTHIAEWVTVQTKLGLPPTHLQIRQAAQRILHASGSTEKLGKNWITEFAHRSPAIKALNGKNIDKERIETVTTIKVQEFFKILNQTPVKDIRPANR